MLKVWTVEKISTGYSTTIISTVINSGISYALWSKPKSPSAGVLWRTGYGVNGSDVQTALFESLNGGVTWAFKKLLFATAGKKYSECDIELISSTTWIAVCREDTGDNNPLFYLKTTDNFATLGVISQFDVKKINGRQPSLIRLADNSIILATGDRAGTSELGSAGDNFRRK